MSIGSSAIGAASMGGNTSAAAAQMVVHVGVGSIVVESEFFYVPLNIVYASDGIILVNGMALVRYSGKNSTFSSSVTGSQLSMTDTTQSFEMAEV